MISDTRVAVCDTGVPGYPAPPFSPDSRYPEYRGTHLNASPNPVYAAVRESFRLLELDAERFGYSDWNPLGAWIQPGSRVLIKPNLVRHYHPLGMDPASLVTHGSLIRAVCDYVLRASGGAELIIADAPLQSCDFSAVRRLAGLDDLERYYASWGVRMHVYDLRLVRAVVEGSSRYGRVLVQEANPGDPLGYTSVDLGRHSLHNQRPVPTSDYRVTCYDPSLMEKYHGEGRHQYVIANSVLDADVVVNLPKMKTHQKAGITGALKNLIGINGFKDCLPHHVRGSAEDGGDEYRHRSRLKELDSWLQDCKESQGGALLKKSVAIAHRLLFATHMRSRENHCWAGSWHGNDTISRTTVDLNRIVRYADRGGIVRSTPQRAVLSIVDGIVAGEEDGPLAPTPNPARVILAGANSVAVDLAMCRLMGFDHRNVPTLCRAIAPEHAFPLANFDADHIDVVSNSARWNHMRISESGDSLRFRPHDGWAGHIEL